MRRHNGIAIVTNQPENEFAKPEGYEWKPFGDKSCFAAKEISDQTGIPVRTVGVYVVVVKKKVFLRERNDGDGRLRLLVF